MKRNIKKLFALACTFTMLTSTVAFGSSESTGGSIIENDNSTPPSYLECILPATNSVAYDFTIDVDDLLASYDRDDKDGTVWEDGKNVYFATIGTPASVVAKEPTKSLYIKEIAKIGTIDDFYRIVEGKKPSDFAALDLKYYVWQPDATSNTGAGKFTQLTDANLEDFFLITLDVDGVVKSGMAIKPNYDTGTASEVCSGDVYVDTYKEVTASANNVEAATYLTVDKTSGTPAYKVNVSDKLYEGLSGKTDADIADASLAALVKDSDVTAQVTYTDAITKYTNISDAATVVNKSTFPVAVSVNVTLTGNHGLTFSSTEAFTASDANEDSESALYVAIQSGANKVALNKDGEATAYYIIPGTDRTDSTYTYKSTDAPDTITGSSNYVQYVAPYVNYGEVDFNLTATANSKTNYDWDAYIASLKDTESGLEKPGVKVVYDFVEVEEFDDGNDETAKTYADTDGVVYTTDGSDGWATTGTAGDSFKMKLKNGAYTYSFVEVPTGSVSAISIDSTSRKGAFDNGNITYSNGVLTINDACVAAWTLTTGDHTVAVTIGRNTYTLTIDN